MKLDLFDFQQAIEQEMHRYLDAYALPSDTIGRPWSSDEVAMELVEMRRCLIEPYWIDVYISDPPHGHSESCKSYSCVAVAEDSGQILMVFMPHLDEYLLLGRVGNGWKSLGVNGDAVGTFLAR